MSIVRKILLGSILVVVLGVLAVPVFAQDNTRTLTEQQINSAYRVTNPARRSITNVHVDLQPGQVVISATLTYRRGNPIQTSTVLVPSVSNGRIYWTVTSATANGQPASAELLAQINTSITTSWRNYVRQQAPTGRVSGIEITDTDLTVTFAASA